MVDGEMIQQWKTPIPYLFGGLTITLVLIAVALLILACSFRKASGGSSNGGDNKTSMGSSSRPEAANLEPRIVVIMAGDHNPTYLAKPLPSPMVTASY